MDRSAGSPLRVLVVEDCKDTSETLQLLLDHWGHEVRVAADGSAALAMAWAFHPDVVLLDLNLRGLDGFDVAAHLLDLPWDRPPVLIAATGYDGAYIRQQALEAGFDHFLPKPFDLPLLRALLVSPAFVPV